MVSDEVKSLNNREEFNHVVSSNPANSFLTLDEVPKKELFFKTYTTLPTHEIGLALLRRLPQLSETIECLLFTSTYKETHSSFIVLATFNKQTNKFLDIKTIGVFEQASDEYYESGFYINQNYEIKLSIQSHYESPRTIKEEKGKILSNGKFNSIYTQQYSKISNTIFYDYNNDYKLRDADDNLVNKVSKDEFNQYLNQIPIVTLPYNSGDFYHLMQIASPESRQPKTTELYHDDLKHIVNVENFLTKKIIGTAFKKNRKTYIQGNYYYPIFRFMRNENVHVIGYLYQSFCNSNPTIYMYLHSYNNQGEILDSILLDRRFFNEFKRFLSSLSFEKNYKIQKKKYIQTFDTMSSDINVKTSTEEEEYFITNNGKFKKIK